MNTSSKQCQVILDYVLYALKVLLDGVLRILSVYVCLQVCVRTSTVLPVSLTWRTAEQQLHFLNTALPAFVPCELYVSCSSPHLSIKPILMTRQHVCQSFYVAQYGSWHLTAAGQWNKRKKPQTMKCLCQQPYLSLEIMGIMHPQGTWVTFLLARRGTWHPASQGQQWDVMEYDWVWWRKMAVIAVVEWWWRCCTLIHMTWCEETRENTIQHSRWTHGWKGMLTKSECQRTDITDRHDEF